MHLSVFKKKNSASLVIMSEFFIFFFKNGIDVVFNELFETDSVKWLSLCKVSAILCKKLILIQHKRESLGLLSWTTTEIQKIIAFEKLKSEHSDNPLFNNDLETKTRLIQIVFGVKSVSGLELS